MKVNSICEWLIFLLAVVVVPANFYANQTANSRFAISTRHITHALLQAGVPTSGLQVELLSPVSSTNINPAINVVNISKWKENSFKALLKCQDNTQCLPFYVLLHKSEGTEIPAPLMNAAELQREPVKKLVEKPLIKTGQRATLVLKSQTMQITLPVVCLENGNKGQRIRVASPDRKQNYQAEVVQAGLLEGTL